MSSFSLASLAAWGVVVAVAGGVRGRPFVFFVAVLLGIHSAIAATLAPSVGPLLPVYAYFHATVYANFLLLARPRMRPLWHRVLLTWPASWFLGSTLLAFPWAIAHALGEAPLGLWVPYLIAAAGFFDAFLPRRGTVRVTLGQPGAAALARSKRMGGRDPEPLRIVQITDPHLGPFMSVRRLRAICERAVAAKPDLLFLTGDFLTMESQGDPTLLGRALAPLAALDGRAFACLGNHDHEALAHVREALRATGVRLLVDEMTRVETRHGAYEILGFDFRFRGRADHLEAVSERHPRSADRRIALLHDPGAFRYLPAGSADLVLSGHTHGGQLGLLWLGLPHTIVSALSAVPDHGLWERGRERLYVHRGTGHYGFPLRLGVPPEESVLELHRAELTG